MGVGYKMKRGNEDASDGVNEDQVSTEQDGSNDEQSAKNNAQAEDSSDSSTKSSVKRMRSEEQEVRLLIPSKAGDNEYELRILIHLSLAGCVIGRGGSKIKEIKDFYYWHPLRYCV
uniref:K Homology domain-containing protein n=1 Tax=Anopheles farauti TaxID=69004 RepID=A0A182QRQ1_9DIPT